jgi:O-antigen ligase
MLDARFSRLERLPAIIAASLLVVLPVVYRPMADAAGQAADTLLGPKTLVAALAALAMAGTHLLLAVAGRRAELPRTMLAALAVFVVTFLVSSIAAGGTDPPVARGVQHALVFVAIFIAVASTPGASSIVMTGAAIGGAIGAVLVIAQAYGWNPPGIHWEEGMALPAGTFPNRNFAAYPIAAGLLVTAGQAIRTPTWRGRVVAGAAAAICALGLVLTCSRGAWAATLVAGTLALVRHLRARRPLVSWGRVALAVSIVAVVTAGTSIRPTPATAEAQQQAAAHPTDIELRLDVAGHHESISTRLDLWRGAVALSAERPLLGWGATGYLERIDGHSPGGSTHTHAHNELLHTAAVAGWPAALAIVAFLLTVVWTAFRRPRADQANTVTLLLLPIALAPAAIEILTLSPVFGPVCAALLGAALAPARRSA